MTNMTPLQTCLAQALAATMPVPAELIAASDACGYCLAEPLPLRADLPRATEALRAGFAVAAFDLVGASSGTPVPLPTSVRVRPGEMLPQGTDAVLPEDGTDSAGGQPEAIRAVIPGEGVRRAGHDGRTGETILRAGQRISARHALLAELAGFPMLGVRRPRVQIALEHPVHAEFARRFMQSLGARIVAAEAELTLRSVDDHAPRLALAPSETAWLDHDGSGLILSVPARFDAMVAACLGLALPAIAALSGAVPRTETRPLARKVTSAVGLSDLVLLSADAGAWVPHQTGTVTLSSLAASRAFAILGADSEGLPAGAPLEAVPLDLPFG